MAGWIGVDLDGTLAKWEDGGNPNGDIGDPLEPMVQRVKGWMADGQEVRIMTARADSSAQIKKVKAWLADHGMDGLAVTNVKDKDMIALYDDRAVRVIRNEGELCPGCAEAVSLARVDTAAGLFRLIVAGFRRGAR